MKQLVLLILAWYVLCMVQCAANSPKPCDTSGIQKKYCVPGRECDPQELIDLRTNICGGKGIFCCKEKPQAVQNDFTECDSGRGYCVGSRLCTVRTYRMRSNRCPSFEEVCCPKLSVVSQSRSTTTEASTATEALTKPTTEDDEKKTSTQNSGSEDVAIANQNKPTSNVASLEDSLPTKAATITIPSTATNIDTEESATQVPELMESENVPSIDDESIKETTASYEAPIVTSTIATTTTTAEPTTIITTTVPIRTPSSSAATIKDTFTPPPATTIKPDEVKNFIPNLLPEFTYEAFTFDECGKRNRHGVVESTIQGENLAEYGEYPWMAALFQVNRDNGEKRYCCNGALVEQFAIVTTAQCFSLCGSKPANMVVRLGEWIMNSTVEPIPHEEIDVDRIIKHPEYRQSSLINNIAVVVLNSSVEYKPTIQPVCLPSKDEEPLGSKENLIATGWGTAVEQAIAGTKAPSKVLKRMDLHTEPFTNCEKIINDSRPFKLHSSFACAGTDHLERPCPGDAGAPVVVEKRPTNDHFYLYGLVSWGFSCSHKNRKETVVTQVEEFKDWIEEILKNPDTEQYKKK